MTGGRLAVGVATGLGPVTGVDPSEAAKMVIGELPDLPHVPQLPERGPWAEPVGRTAALLVDLPVELDVGRWRAASGVGRDLRRAASLLVEDLDALEEHWAGYRGPAKLQICGPLTVMAAVELRGGEAMVTDPLARNDLATSLAEGMVSHVADLRRRVPGAEWCVQVDEHLASAVTGGLIARPSGWGTVAAVATSDAASLLRGVVDAMHGLECGVVVHVCDAEPDWPLLTACGTDGVRLSPEWLQMQSAAEEALEQWWGSGRGLWCGIDAAAAANAQASMQRVRSVVGSDPQTFAERVVVTPECGPTRGGSVGDDPVGARAYADLRALMKRLHDD